MSKIKLIIENYKKQKEEMLEEMRTELKPYLQSLCNDIITSYKFTCYTPHFSDGDVCTFGVNEVYVKYVDMKVNDDEDEDGDGFTYGYGCDKKVQNEINKINKAIQGIPEEFIQDVLGDGVEVVITNDSVEINDYEHD